ncbi:MAG: hypothetical protein ACRDKV_06245 [Solirubrobacterales bacterium]
MGDRRRGRRHSWNRSQSDSGFRPIKQVGYATSIGFPLLAVGIFMFAIAYSASETILWVVAVGLLVGGLLIAASGRIT